MKKMLFILCFSLLLTGCGDNTKEIVCTKTSEEEKTVTKILVNSSVKDGQIDEIKIESTIEYKDKEFGVALCNEYKLIDDSINCEEGKIVIPNVQNKIVTDEQLKDIRKVKTKEYMSDMDKKGYVCETK